MLPRRLALLLAVPLAAAGLAPPPAPSACCYFSAKDKDILQPAQKVFLSYDPATQRESFIVQPKFEGNAVDFGMVIPTPTRPKLEPVARDFFKELAVWTILKKREYPESKLLPRPQAMMAPSAAPAGARGGREVKSEAKAVRVLESGVVGSLEYKIIEAGRADDLYSWLKTNNYAYAGDEATLAFYIKKQWLFTVMKIDTTQMKKAADGSYAGEVTPTHFAFTSDTFVYPLRITQLSVKDKTEALFYVQAPYKTDLPGDLTYQYQWVPMLQNAQGWYAKGIFGTNDLPGRADDWLKTLGGAATPLVQKGQQLGYGFVSGQRPQPNAQGHVATTLEWARRIDKDDLALLKGDAAFGETVPDPDAGFTQADLADAKKRDQAYKTINARLEQYRKERPGGYLVRSAPADDVKALKLLLGHVKEGQFVTKFRKVFARDEMSDDLSIVPAEHSGTPDRSEYTEGLPTSPP